MSATLVTILSSDVSSNALARSHALREMVSRRFDVEIVGTSFGQEVWRPLGDQWRLQHVRGRLWPAYAASFLRLQRLIRGSVIYAVKPLVTSFGAALWNRAWTGRPVVLDIDDDEVALRRHPRQYEPRFLAAALADPNGRFLAAKLMAQVSRADAITVATTALQRRFGGVLVPHARDLAAWRPRPELRDVAKKMLDLEGRRVVMFFGTPRPHKGLEDAATAVQLMQHDDAVLVVVGADDDPYSLHLQAQFPWVQFREPVSWSEGPFVIQAADAVVIPQRSNDASRHQLPAKLVDAMAAGKPVVSTAVGDIPRLLADRRGIVVPPSDPAALAAALDRLFDRPEEAAAIGAAARAWCERYLDYGVVATAVTSVIERVASGERLNP